MLARAWRIVVQRLRRKYVNATINYFVIVEATKRGEPHLHILLRSPYIPQALLSDYMGEILSSPIVDIRLVKSQREVVRYITKYITKDPHRFGTCKRYWSSRDYECDKSFRKAKAERLAYPWTIDRRPVYQILSEWVNEGYYPRRERGDVIIGIGIRAPP